MTPLNELLYNEFYFFYSSFPLIHLNVLPKNGLVANVGDSMLLKLKDYKHFWLI